MIQYRLPRDKRLPELINALEQIKYVSDVTTDEHQRLLNITLTDPRKVRVTLYRIGIAFDEIGMHQTKCLGSTESPKAGDPVE